MTLLDVRRLTAYAKDHPSLRSLVACCAAALGVQLPTPKSTQPQSHHLSLAQTRAFVQQANAELAGLKHG